MPLDPDNQPREFLSVLIAAGLFIFRSNIPDASKAFEAAEEFVAEAERRFGRINP